MGSVFEDNFAAAGWPVLLAQHGQSITYTPKGGSGVAVTAIVGPERREERDEEDGIQQYRVRDVIVSTADVASPQLNASVTIGSETWQVAEPMEITGSTACFAVVLPALVQRSTAGYRS